ncbi:MAG: hypothetical protein GX241_01855 [Ruminococcaceae bacterium]|nr:hypothetical protein [Oscillospiraceae bacterium]
MKIKKKQNNKNSKNNKNNDKNNNKNDSKNKKGNKMQFKRVEYCGKHYSVFEYGTGFLLGAVLGYVVANVIYEKMMIALILAICFGVVGSVIYVNHLFKKRKEEFSHEFCDYLDSICNSLSCGKNTYESFVSADYDMRGLYAKESPICIESAKLVNGLKTGRGINELLFEMAENSLCEDVKIFGDVYDICNKTGGNLKKVVVESKNIIIEKISIESEIRTMLSEPKNELNIMSAMPIAIVMALKMISNNSDEGSSFFINTIALIIFGASYYLGQKLVNIKV